jgi:hypothetical protein
VPYGALSLDEVEEICLYAMALGLFARATQKNKEQLELVTLLAY